MSLAFLHMRRGVIQQFFFPKADMITKRVRDPYPAAPMRFRAGERDAVNGHRYSIVNSVELTTVDV